MSGGKTSHTQKPLNFPPEFGDFVKEISNGVTLVDFYADWCGPCKALSPVIEKIAIAHKDKVKVCKINVDTNPEFAAKFNIRSIPFLAFIKNGEKVDELVGNQSEKNIVEKLSKL